MTEVIYLEVTETAETVYKAERLISVSGMLKHLGISHSVYHAWLKCVPSNTEKRYEAVKAKIKDIYDEQNRIMAHPKSPKSYVKQEKSSPSVPLVSI